MKSKRGLGKQVARAREEWIAVEVPAIISRETFDMARERLKRNIEQAIRNSKREYLLGRRLKCSVCGYSVVGMTRREKHRYYRCNGAWRKPKVCDMPNFRVGDVDTAVWVWLKEVVENPERITKGLRGVKEETNEANRALNDRLAIIDKKLEEGQLQLSRLLDLFLSGDFSKELLQERKSRLEETIANLQYERVEISSHLKTVTVTDNQIAEIEAFCNEIRGCMEDATFQQMRQLIDFLDVRGTLAIENGEKVVYVKCQFLKHEQQRVSVARTSHLSNTGKRQPVVISVRLVIVSKNVTSRFRHDN